MGKQSNKYRLRFGKSKITKSLSKVLCDGKTDKEIAICILAFSKMFSCAESMRNGKYDGDWELKRIH